MLFPDAMQRVSVLTLALLGSVIGQVHAGDVNQGYRLREAPTYVKAADAAADRSLKLLKRTGYVETAQSLVESITPNATFRTVQDHYVGTNGMSHVNFKQTAHGLDIDNADFSVHMTSDGSIFSYSNSFFEDELPSEGPFEKRSSLVDPAEAVTLVLETFSFPVKGSARQASTNNADVFKIQGISGLVKDPQVSLAYLVQPSGQLSLAWRVETQHAAQWLSSYVTAESKPVIIGVVSHLSHATYEVYPWGINDPTEGERSVEQDTPDAEASPNGWHFPGGLEANTTMGNNVDVGGVPSNSGLVNYPYSENYTFEYPYVPDNAPPVEYLDAAITQVFYTVNMAHELYYILGFTEAAGNMQDDNHGKGGKENDAVQVYVQHWSGTNNGVMSRTADGTRSYMNLYVFDKTDPERDVAFDNGFVIHEYTHGLSNRLTGGPDNNFCLDSYEADGMAEGWSDLFAAAIMLKPDDTRDTAYYGFAAWPLDYANETARIALYSTDEAVNDLTYASVNGREKVHEIGTVWATMLYDALWNLIDKHGKNDGPRPEMGDGGVPADGKYLTMKLVADGLALQPCNPTFIQARDAILDADLALTGGDNQCDLWAAFSKRGLGYNVVFDESNRVDNFDMAPECE